MTGTRSRKRMAPRRPSVSQHRDYRGALASMWRWRRAQDDFPYRNQGKLATALFCSQSHLSLIFNGKRHPHPMILKRLLDILQFEPDERRLIEELAALAQTRHEEVRTAIARRVARLRRLREHRDLPPDSDELLAEPLVPVVFEAMGLAGFDGRMDWLVAGLRNLAEPADVEAAVERLIECKLADRDGDGRLRRLFSSLDCPRPDDEAARAYHGGQASLAAEAAMRIDPDRRRFAAVTTTLPRAALPRFFERLEAMQAECVDWLLGWSQDPGEVVVQLHLAAYAVGEGAPADAPGGAPERAVPVGVGDD